MPAAQELGRKMAQGPAVTQQLVKHMVREIHTKGYEAHWKYIDAAHQHTRETHDYDEGVRSFIEKRPSEFKGY